MTMTTTATTTTAATPPARYSNRLLALAVAALLPLGACELDPQVWQQAPDLPGKLLRLIGRSREACFPADVRADRLIALLAPRAAADPARKAGRARLGGHRPEHRRVATGHSGSRHSL